MTSIKKDATVRPVIHTDLEEKIAQFGMNWYGSMMRGELQKWISHADTQAARIAELERERQDVRELTSDDFMVPISRLRVMDQEMAELQADMKKRGEIYVAEYTKQAQRIQELEEARNKHWRGEEIAVRQLEIVKAQGEALAKAVESRDMYTRQCELDALKVYRTANPDKGE